MFGHNHIHEILKPILVPDEQRLSHHDCALLDDHDASIVLENLDEYIARLDPIIEQLHAFTGKTFTITYTRNNVCAEARDDDIIEIDYATLKGEQDELAYILSHEWAHHDLDHLRNTYNNKRIEISREEAEHSADYYAGIFLGYHGYDLHKALRNKLRRADGDSAHGSRPERATIVTKGYLQGREMVTGKLAVGFVPAYLAYVKKNRAPPWYCRGGQTAYTIQVLNKLRRLSK